MDQVNIIIYKKKVVKAKNSPLELEKDFKDGMNKFEEKELKKKITFAKNT